MTTGPVLPSWAANQWLFHLHSSMLGEAGSRGADSLCRNHTVLAALGVCSSLVSILTANAIWREESAVR